MMPSMKVLTIWNFALSLSWLDYQQNSSYNPSQPRQKSSKSACLFWPRLWPKCVRKRVDAMDKTLQNPALFADGTDVFGVKTLHITNRSQLAVMRSAVRSRLSPPEKSWNLTISGLFLYFLPQIIDRIFAVMRPDPDLTQTGAKLLPKSRTK